MTAVLLLMLVQDPFDALVRDLGAEEYDVRERAMDALLALGREAGPRMREAMARTRDPEVKARLVTLLIHWHPVKAVLSLSRSVYKLHEPGNMNPNGHYVLPGWELRLWNVSPRRTLVATIWAKPEEWQPVRGTYRIRAIYDSTCRDKILYVSGLAPMITLEAIKPDRSMELIIVSTPPPTGLYWVAPWNSITSSIGMSYRTTWGYQDFETFADLLHDRLESDWVELTVTD